MKTSVGVVGVGNMGLGMALRLREQGHPVLSCDLRPERVALACAELPGAAPARGAATPQAVAAACELVVVAVVDAAQTDAVVLGDGPERPGLLAAARPGLTVMLCPTIAPQDVQRLGRRLADAGVATIDAPMSGGPARARDGSMSLMLAADAAVLARWDGVLAALAAHRFPVGDRLGDAARTKLVNNLLAAVNLAGAAEALALAQRLGLDAARTLAVIERSSGASWIGSDRLRRALADDLAPRAHSTLLAKDSKLALAMARAAGVEPALGAGAAEIFAGACAAGWAGLDDASLFSYLLGRPAPPAASAPAGSAP